MQCYRLSEDPHGWQVGFSTQMQGYRLNDGTASRQDLILQMQYYRLSEYPHGWQAGFSTQCKAIDQVTARLAGRI
jgi:hypothetical protein